MRLPTNGSNRATSTRECLRDFYEKCMHACNSLAQADVLRLAASSLAGAVAFPVCLGAIQRLFFAPLGLSCATPYGNVLGACAVAVSGLSATQITCIVWNKLVGDSRVLEEIEYPVCHSLEEFLIGGGVSLTVYVLLRGGLRAVLPSDVINPGAFAGEGLAATESYASSSKRSKLTDLGRRHGCHTCGARVLVDDFIADHQPPLAIIRMRRSSKKSIFARILNFFRKKKRSRKGSPPEQRFYPQCNPCSVRQLTYLSAASRGLKRPSPLVTHGSSLRLRHLFLPIPLLVLSAYRFCAFGD